MNPYLTLGIRISASKAEIKRAYKKMAAECHPDKEGGSDEAFQKLKLAYDVLYDIGRRAKYDKTGEFDSSKSKQDPVNDRIVQLFVSMINEEKFTGNIIENAIDIVRGAIGDLISASCKADTELKKLNRLIGRVKCKEDCNMYEVILTGKIKELTDRLEKMNTEHEVMEDVLEKLSSYSDESPEPEAAWATNAWRSQL